jgi:hypothetical protein
MAYACDDRSGAGNRNLLYHTGRSEDRDDPVYGLTSAELSTPYSILPVLS